MNAFVDIKRMVKQLTVILGLAGSLVSGANAQSLKVGVIAPLTGPAAGWGVAMAEAPRILAAEINAKGGLEVGGKKHQIEVIAYDDQYKAAEAIAAYNRLVTQDKVKFIMTLASPTTLALKDKIESDKILALTSSGTNKAIDDQSKYLFRLYSRPAEFLPGMVQWVKGNIKERNIAYIDANDETGWDHSQLSARYWPEAGFKFMSKDLYERTAKDFQPLLTKIIASKPDLIDIGASAPATAGLIIRQARELGYKGRFVKTGGSGFREILEAAGKEAAEGLISPMYADTTHPEYRRIAAAYKKTVGQDPNELLAPLYDAWNVLFRAIQSAGTIDDTTKVTAAFPKVLPTTSLMGDRISLGKQQFLNTNYIGIIKNGEAVTVGKVE